MIDSWVRFQRGASGQKEPGAQGTMESGRRPAPHTESHVDVTLGSRPLYDIMVLYPQMLPSDRHQKSS